MIRSVLRRFSRLLFACVPLLLVAIALMPATPADAYDIDICDRTPQVRDAIMKETNLLRFFLGMADCSAFDSANLRDIADLDISGSGIKELKKGDFSDLQNLSHLNLSNNGLQSLDSKLFSKLGNLEDLDLSHNQLEKYPEDILENLNSVNKVTVVLSCNPFKMNSIIVKSAIRVIFSGCNDHH